MPSLARLSEAVLGEMAGAVAGNLSCVVSNTTTDGEVNILCSNGIEYAPYHSHTLKPGTTQFWINIGICVLLILLAGVFSGLTLGLLSYDPNTLKVIMEGGKPAQAKSAKAVLPLVRHHHLLLVTLLLCNAGVNESLPLFLDDLVPSPIYAILISVTAVLMFGEVIPQALCSKHGLRIGSFFSPFVWFLIAVTFPLSYPLSRLLDLLLGADHSAFFRRAELGALVQIHGEDQVHNEEILTDDEIMIIKGALEMESKVAADAMQPLDSVFMLPTSGELDLETMDKILDSGHSRVPLYQLERQDTSRFLLVKNLIKFDPNDATPIATLPSKTLLRVQETTRLYDLLNLFQTGEGHLAMVGDAKGVPVGIITLEDVIEELIGEEIEDETDLPLRMDVLRRLSSVRGNSVSDDTVFVRTPPRARRTVTGASNTDSVFGSTPPRSGLGTANSVNSPDERTRLLKK